MDTYGIIGFPLGHSFSKRYFTEKFRRENRDAEYLNFEIRDISEVTALLSKYVHLKGFNVTIPYKQAILPFLDDISEEAREIGAVNCVKTVRQGSRFRLIGYNTDACGFKEALLRFIPEGIASALILGNGGAAKAVRYVLHELHIHTLTVSRTPRTAHEIGYPEIAALLPEYHLIVNTTPLGTWPDVQNSPALPYPLLTSRHYLFDLVYNPETTLFMQQGAAYGAHTCNGLNMLLSQAEKGWRIWNPDEFANVHEVRNPYKPR